MSVTKLNGKILVSDESRKAAKAILLKYKDKKVKQLTTAEQVELLTALLQHLGLADAEEKIK